VLDNSPEIFGFIRYYDTWGLIYAELNDSTFLQCRVQAPIGVTIIVWLKDDIPVKNTEHYTIITTTNPPRDNYIVSNLYINSVTKKDEGIYACYCYYNTTMVTSRRPIISRHLKYTLIIRGI